MPCNCANMSFFLLCWNPKITAHILTDFDCCNKTCHQITECTFFLLTARHWKFIKSWMKVDSDNYSIVYLQFYTTTKNELSNNRNLAWAELLRLSCGVKTHFDFEYFDAQNFEHPTTTDHYFQVSILSCIQNIQPRPPIYLHNTYVTA